MRNAWAWLTVAGVAGLLGCTPGTPAPAPSPERSGDAGGGAAAPAGGSEAGQTPAGAEPAGAGPGAANTPATGEQTGEQPEEPTADDRYVLGVSMNRIDGQPESLEAYRGKVVLVVNVASACGLTPQYEGLQALYDDKADEGLVVLGFPANNFGNQEPGSNQEIVEFCTGEYGVSFPMFEKISVVGEDQHPLYGKLSQEGGPPTWNFTKYLVDREGRVVARFDPRTRPDDPALVAKVNELLAQ